RLVLVSVRFPTPTCRELRVVLFSVPGPVSVPVLFLVLRAPRLSPWVRLGRGALSDHSFGDNRLPRRPRSRLIPLGRLVPRPTPPPDPSPTCPRTPSFWRPPCPPSSPLPPPAPNAAPDAAPSASAAKPRRAPNWRPCPCRIGTPPASTSATKAT